MTKRFNKKHSFNLLHLPLSNKRICLNSYLYLILSIIYSYYSRRHNLYNYIKKAYPIVLKRLDFDPQDLLTYSLFFQSDPLLIQQISLLRDTLIPPLMEIGKRFPHHLNLQQTLLRGCLSDYIHFLFETAVDFEPNLLRSLWMSIPCRVP